MKIKCDFCKTEYSVSAYPSSPVRCAICGHVWRVARPRHMGPVLVIISGLCAVLAAAVFAVTVIVRERATRTPDSPLTATVMSVTTENDDAGTPHFVVTGRIANNTDEIYGVPDLIIISRDGSGNIIARQKFMPSATLLDAGASVEFMHTLSVPVTGVKKIGVELSGMEDLKNEKK